MKAMRSMKALPEVYTTPAEHQGTVTRIDYTTKDKNSGEPVAKHAYVYLPYGYDETKEYDILYCLHGGGGEIEVYFGIEGGNEPVKVTLDNMIERGDIKPIIAVSPTYYNADRRNALDSSVAQIERFCEVELVEDLIPAVEGKYSTYAKTTDREGIKASREHRGYTGYSMGSLSTWCTLIHNADCFKYYMPQSGDFWVDGVSKPEISSKFINDTVKSFNLKPEDINVHAITGTADIAYERMLGLLDALEETSDFFHFGSDTEKGNIDFRAEKDATHDYIYMPLYFYNVIPEFFK